MDPAAVWGHVPFPPHDGLTQMGMGLIGCYHSPEAPHLNTVWIATSR
jgi:hypothetical protein